MMRPESRGEIDLAGSSNRKKNKSTGMLVHDKELHHRLEFVGIYPNNATLRIAAKALGGVADRGAADIFGHRGH